MIHSGFPRLFRKIDHIICCLKINTVYQFSCKKSTNGKGSIRGLRLKSGGRYGNIFEKNALGKGGVRMQKDLTVGTPWKLLLAFTL
ncbi:MAG: hypothetical protein IKU12_06990, partial [Oscillospiraceae bacterium]|nr:hypothetical protein [Oscillospiraceae bacterium]